MHQDLNLASYILHHKMYIARKQTPPQIPYTSTYVTLCQSSQYQEFIIAELMVLRNYNS